MASQTVEDFYISKKHNFIKFLKEVAEQVGEKADPAAAEARAEAFLKAEAMDFEGLVTQGNLIRTLKVAGQLSGFVETLLKHYGISSADLSMEVLHKINRYIDLFSQIGA